MNTVNSALMRVIWWQGQKDLNPR